MRVSVGDMVVPDVVIEDPRWIRLGVVSADAVGAVLKHLGVDSDAAEIAVLGCDDARIAALNANFRGKDTPTNVLSWPAQDLTPPAPPVPDPDGTVPLGDIALSYDTCAREAADQGKTLAAHATHLIVHGTLHLLGYDHERDRDAAVMEALEIEILCNLGLPDPYS